MMLAFGPLRLAPQHFWCMSPREMQAALDGFYGGGLEGDGVSPLTRNEFEALRDQFPDQGHAFIAAACGQEK